MKWLEVHQNNVKLPESVQKKAKKFNHPPTDFLQQSSIKVDKTLFKLTITYQKTNQDDPEQSCVEISFDSKKMILVLENGKSAQLDSCVIKQEPRPLEFSRNSGYIQAIFYRVLVCMEDGNSTFIPDDSLPALKVLRVHYKAKSPNGIELTSEMDECSYVLDGDLMQVEKANTIPKVLNHQPLPVENIDYESGRNEFGKREWDLLGQILENAENESMNLETPKKLKLTTPKKVKSATPTRSNTPRKITPRNASKTPGFVKPMSIRNALSKESGIKPLQNLEPKDILMEESSTTTMEETCAKNSILPVLENTQSSITNGADNLEQSDFVPTVQYRRRVPLYVGGQIFRITVHLDSTKAVLEKSINLVTKQSGLELEWGSGNVKYGWSELNDQLINKLDSILVQ